jgi:uncharacterized membrane protein YgaE (UPF0421/DUF939 family)
MMDRGEPIIEKRTEERMTAMEGFIFASKAAVSAVAAVVVFNLFGLPGGVWAPVSAVIVTQPKLHPSLKLSLSRVVANLIGAFVGALMSAVTGHTILAMALGVVVTGLVCCAARLDDAIRPAYAAVVIVTLSNEPEVWAGSLDRVLAVTLGCVVALAVGVGFDLVSRVFARDEGRKGEMGDGME